MELIKTIRARVGTVRSRIFRTPRAFSGKSRVLPTTQSATAARRCGRFGEPCFCCAKMVRLSTRPKQKQTIKKMELIKTIRTRVGTLRLAELRPLMRFPQFVACSRLHGRKKFLFPPFRRTMFLLRKNGSIIHPPQTKTDHQKDGLFLFGGRGWIRTTEAEKQQIYSLPPLATRELAHNGAGDGTRTRNLLITNQLLCQLSYTSDESSPNVESFSTLTDYTI